MLNADAIKLIKQTFSVNEYGDSIPTETIREIYAEVKSIGLKRKIEAEQMGLKLDLKFVLSNVAEYQDEEILEFHGKRLNIVNVYVTDEEKVELTTARF